MELGNMLAQQKYYGRFQSEDLRISLEKEVGMDIDYLNKEWVNVFYDMLNKDPNCYWNREIFRQTKSLLEKFYNDIGQELTLDDLNFNFFIMGYNSYCQMGETILDLQNFNISEDIKTRLYRVPTYIALVESCMANFLRVIAAILTKATDKDYSKQNSLKQLLDVMQHNGFTEIVKDIDGDIRNSINHGRFMLQRTPQEVITFVYEKDRATRNRTIPLYEFDNIINRAYDAVSAVLLAMAVFINKNIKISDEDCSNEDYKGFALMAMRLSMPGVVCQSISDTPDIGKHKQINIEVDVTKTDINFLVEVSMDIVMLVHNLYSDYDQYLVSFNNPWLGMGWIRYTNKQITTIKSDIGKMSEVFQEIAASGELMYMKEDTDSIAVSEAKYFCFPNYNSGCVKVNHIYDASMADRKRLRANVFIGDVRDKSEILQSIEEAINWLKTLKNAPSTTTVRKYGAMEADALYINIYKKDLRHDKSITHGNSNFICFVDYNLTGETTLEHGGILQSEWNKLHHEKVGNCNIAWREGKYSCRTVRKIGPNELCPCGSGKKFKKCCRGKGIYD